MCEPFSDVIQDLWQLSHVTASYVARAAAGGIFLATGIIDDNTIAIVVAACARHENRFWMEDGAGHGRDRLTGVFAD
jgi:hypothetical protein